MKTRKQYLKEYIKLCEERETETRQLNAKIQNEYKKMMAIYDKWSRLRNEEMKKWFEWNELPFWRKMFTPEPYVSLPIYVPRSRLPVYNLFPFSEKGFEEYMKEQRFLEEVDSLKGRNENKNKQTS